MLSFSASNYRSLHLTGISLSFISFIHCYQIAYSCSVHDIAKSSAQMLWRYFVSDQDNTPEDLSSAYGQSKLKIIRYGLTIF